MKRILTPQILTLLPAGPAAAQHPAHTDALHLSDGSVLRRDFQPGQAMYSAGEAHVGENVGSTPTRILMVELKGVRP